MKKYLSTFRFRKQSDARGRHELKAKRRRDRREKRTNLSANRRKQPFRIEVGGGSRKQRAPFNLPVQNPNRIIEDPFRDYDRVVAPRDFRFLDNTSAVVDLINQLSLLYDLGRKAFVDLAEVKEIDNSAVLVLFSIMVRFKAKDLKFNGNQPLNRRCNNILKNSGFYDRLYDRYVDEDSYTIENRDFAVHAAREVLAPETAKILASASLVVWGERRRTPEIQTNLIELAQNTEEHAAPGQDEGKHWWLSVHPDRKKHKASFSFVDYGVGIFQSLENKPQDSKFFGALKIIREKFNKETNSELLRLILEGQLHETVTGEYYRGQGLPGLRDSVRANSFSRLFVISNTAFADVTNDIYVELEQNFTGTFVYWELETSNRSLDIGT